VYQEKGRNKEKDMYMEMLMFGLAAVETAAKLMFHLIQPIVEALVSQIQKKHTIHIDYSGKGEN